MTVDRTLRRCIGARAAALLRQARDTLELAARPPGDLITITRQDVDLMINDLGAIEKIISEMAEGGS